MTESKRLRGVIAENCCDLRQCQFAPMRAIEQNRQCRLHAGKSRYAVLQAVFMHQRARRVIRADTLKHPVGNPFPNRFVVFCRAQRRIDLPFVRITVFVVQHQIMRTGLAERSAPAPLQTLQFRYRLSGSDMRDINRAVAGLRKMPYPRNRFCFGKSRPPGAPCFARSISRHIVDVINYHLVLRMYHGHSRSAQPRDTA